VGKNGYVPEVVGPMRWTGRRRRGELGFATPEGANQAATPDGAMPDGANQAGTERRGRWRRARSATRRKYVRPPGCDLCVAVTQSGAKRMSDVLDAICLARLLRGLVPHARCSRETGLRENIDADERRLRGSYELRPKTRIDRVGDSLYTSFCTWAVSE
jgi:hypothetical protein